MQSQITNDKRGNRNHDDIAHVKIVLLMHGLDLSRTLNQFYSWKCSPKRHRAKSLNAEKVMLGTLKNNDYVKKINYGYNQRKTIRIKDKNIQLTQKNICSESN